MNTPQNSSGSVLVPSAAIKQWRIRALDRMLKVFFLLLLVPLVLVGLDYFKQGFILIGITLALSFCGLGVVAWLPRLGYRTRAVSLLVLLVFGTVLAAASRGMSVGYGIGFVFAIIVATLFFDYKSAVFAWVLSLLLTVVTGYLISNGFTTHTQEEVASLAFDRWLVAVPFVGAMSALCAVMIHFLLRSLEESTNRSQQLIEELREALLSQDQEALAHRLMRDKISHFQAQESLGLLAGHFAHDICNNLALIQGSVDVMRMDPGRNLLEDIEFAAADTALIARNMMALGRQDIANPAVLNLNDFLNDRKSILERVAKDCTINISTNVYDAQVMVDAALLQQCLINLVSNACEAASETGNLAIDISLEKYATAPGETAINGMELGSKNVELLVSDHGPGVSAEKLEQIFEPFFTTKGLQEGSGLGLPAVKHFMEESGGKIHLNSDSKGTRFGLVFPVIGRAHSRDTQDIENSLSTLRILVVDDDASQVRLTSRLLEHRGSHVVNATSGDEALLKCSDSGPFDLLCTDAIMPGMDGGELARHFKKIYPNAKVLVCTAHVDSSFLKSLLEDEDYDVLNKPFRSEMLYSAISKLIEKG